MFFGWAIVAFTFVVQFATVGTVFYAYSVLLKPLTEAFETDRFLVSLALSLHLAFGALVGPVVGKLVAERSIRLLMLAGCASLALGFVALSLARELWHLYAAMGVILGAGMALTGPLPNNTLLTNWFVQLRGTAMGISQFGISISGTVLVPLTAWLVLENGWRFAAGLYALVPLVVLAPLVWKLAVKRPEDMGLWPDGASVSGAGPALTIDADWTMRRALRDRRVWLLAAIIGPGLMGITSVVLAMHSHITDLGLSPLRASTVVAVMTFMGAIAKPLFGTLSDFADKRLAMGLSLLCQITGLTIIVALDGYPGLIAGGLLFGLGYGAILPLWAVLIGALFGRDAFARIMGAMGPITLPFTLLGLPFTTFVFESTGSYVPAFAALLGALSLSGIALAFLRLPATADAAILVAEPASIAKEIKSPSGTTRSTSSD